MNVDDNELNYTNNVNLICKDDKNNVPDINEFSENNSMIESMSDISLDRLNDGLKIKPEHWTDEYYQTITSTYKWFIHKDGFVGCCICFVNKTFMGKKSLIATMKMRMMELTYLEFEKKLSDHSSSIQHSRSIKIYRGLDQKNNASEINITNEFHLTPKPESAIKRASTDFMCSFCNKGYKLRKALVKHVYGCIKEDQSKGFLSPCCCDGCTLYTICDIDDHYKKAHNGKYIFNCTKCPEQFKSATNLFEHFLIFHDHQWNPTNEMPTTTENSDTVTRADRKKSFLNDDIYLRYDQIEEQSFTNNVIDKDMTGTHDKNMNTEYGMTMTNTTEKKAIKRRKVLKEDSVSDNKIEKIMNHDKKETSHLMLSLNQIHTCDYCGGRYLSVNILNEHINTRHMSGMENVENEDENLKRKYRRKLIAITESLRDPSPVKKIELETTEKLVKRPYTKRKTIDTVAKTDPARTMNDNQTSACLLTCPACQESFLNLESRNEHVSKHHPEIQQFNCQHCGLIFTNHTNYNKHLEKSHNSNALPKANKNVMTTTYSCTICPLVFTNTADLNHHTSFSHPDEVEKPVIVNLGAENIEPSDFIQEMEMLPDKEEEEEEEAVYMSDDVLANLVDADYRQCDSACTQCDLVSHNSFELAVHSLTHGDNGKEATVLPSCPSCDRLFFGEHSKMYLLDHYNSDHLKKCAPQCSSCDISFTSSLLFEKHVVDGVCQPCTTEDPYQPLLCEEKYAFTCPNCGSIFAGQSAKSRLESHGRTCSSDLMDEDDFLE